MKTYHEKIENLTRNIRKCPLPLSVIPDTMGINLVSVDSIAWQTQDDGQLTNLTIYFIPNNTIQPIDTIEPIYDDTDKENYNIIGFVRGFVEKYKNVNIGQQNIFYYLNKLVGK